MLVPYSVRKCLQMGIMQQMNMFEIAIKNDKKSEMTLEEFQEAVEWYEAYCLIGVKYLYKQLKYIEKICEENDHNSN